MTTTILCGDTFKDFEVYIKNSYNGNNHVYKIEMRMYDGPKPVVLRFTAPEGFERDQSRRRGTIEQVIE